MRGLSVLIALFVVVSPQVIVGAGGEIYPVIPGPQFAGPSPILLAPPFSRSRVGPSCADHPGTADRMWVTPTKYILGAIVLIGLLVAAANMLFGYKVPFQLSSDNSPGYLRGLQVT
jgi:hypothetical protein